MLLPTEQQIQDNWNTVFTPW